jgi:hypothetical protein
MNRKSSITLRESVIGFGVSKVVFWNISLAEPISIQFLNAGEVKPIGIKETSFQSNFFLGERGTYTDVSSFSEIIYHNLWPGINLRYYHSENGLKYEFEVEPGAQPDTIKMRYGGQKSIQTTPDSISIVTESTNLHDTGLYVYQEDGVHIPANFVQYSPNLIGFTVAKYDESQKLVIDPLLYSTYLGGPGTDYGYSIEIGPQGNLFVTGRTNSVNFPLLNAYNGTLQGTDCFVIKLNRTGNGIIYSTFVGGSGGDVAQSIAIDDLGRAYVTGYTTSTDFPSVYPYDDTYNGGDRDCFVFRLNSTGNGLDYSTYVGGSDTDDGYALAIDDSYCVYVAGITDGGLPTKNAFDSTYNGGRDCFLFSLNATGNGLNFSTYIGGSGYDRTPSVTVNPRGEIYVSGTTGSDNFPLYRTIDGIRNGDDCFLTGFHEDGSSLIISTFFGGAFIDIAWDITSDSDGYVYITGATSSDDFPTVSAYQSLHSGSQDVFVIKIDAIGRQILYSTFLGGYESDAGLAIAVDRRNYAYISGYTGSYNFAPSNSDNSTYQGNLDAFLAVLNSDGTELDYFRYLGGSNREDGYGVAATNSTVSVVGRTESPDFTTYRAYNETFGGGWDVFLCQIPTSLDSDNDTLLDAFEELIGTDPNNSDSDFDLMPDGWEYIHSLNPLNASDAGVDSDTDGLSNLEEYQNNTDPNDSDSDDDSLSDGSEVNVHFTDPNNSDTDYDLMPDEWEITYNLNPLVDDANEDPDSDLLINLFEYGNGTIPTNPDTDSDLMLDGWEVRYGLNATNSSDALDDNDSDDLTNLEEHQNGTDPTDSDSDDDDLLDGEEVSIYFTDPLDSDSDDDNLTDGQEVHTHGTDPNNPDTDSDGINDGAEIDLGLNPLVPDADTDSDGDGIIDSEEVSIGTDPNESDTDHDGLPDGWEVDRGLDPLEWTMNPGQASSYVFSFLLLGALPAIAVFAVLMFAVVTGVKNKSIRLLGRRALLIPGIILLLVFFLTVPGEAAVLGSTDPGSNSTSQTLNTEGSISFALIDGTPWFTNRVTVSVSARLTILGDYLDGTVTVTQDGSTLGSFDFEFGRGAFIETETESSTYTADPSGGQVIIELTYLFYNNPFEPDKGDFPMTLLASQGEADGRNVDQQTWPSTRNGLMIVSIGVVVLGVILPTSRKIES